MDGSLPIFLLPMKAMLTAFVGMDCQRGLNMLKDYLETGAVPSKLDFLGRQSFAGFAYLGMRNQCSMTEIGPRMREDFRKLREGLCASSEQATGEPFAIYHDWNPMKGTTDYTIGFPVSAVPSTVPKELSSGELPTCEVYSIRHTGPYRHLANAWSAGMIHGRAKAFEPNKATPSFEIYESDPNEVAENELITVVHLAAK
jgi:effector-binding domain-containing protein